MKTFVSYTHQDERWFDQLKLHIAPLLRNGTISIWSDHHILAGQPLNSEIESNMATAELFILVLSPAYLASDYCMNVELEHAISRYQLNEVRIIPIIVESCKWDSIPNLKDLKIIPKDAKPVSKWSDKNSAFVGVVEEIEQIVRIETEKKVIDNSMDKNDSTFLRSLSEHHIEQRVKKEMHVQEFIKQLNMGNRNFSGVRIKNLELIDYILQKVDFSEADLSGARLEGANLVGANFVNANLEAASLYSTILDGANLSAANLVKVNLTGANLDCVNFWCCNMRGAQFEESNT